MSRHADAIFKTARAAAFVFAAVALLQAGASAQEAGAAERQNAKPPAAAATADSRPAPPPSAPPAVAVDYEAPARLERSRAPHPVATAPGTDP